MELTTTVTELRYALEFFLPHFRCVGNGMAYAFAMLEAGLVRSKKQSQNGPRTFVCTRLLVRLS